MTICLLLLFFSICLFLAGLCKYYWLDPPKNQKMGLGATKISLDFENDLDRCLDTKK